MISCLRHVTLMWLNNDAYVGFPYSQAEMYDGRVACCSR